MNAVERQRRIVSLVDNQGSVRASELASMFEVTHETIRLDLEKLEKEGLLVRRHGRAVSVRELSPETPLSQREVALLPEKQLIARAAARHVKDSDTIFLDASSSALQLARVLPDVPLTVVTNAMRVGLELARRRNARVILLGGSLASASLSLVGPMAERCLEEYHIDKAFVSCAGLDIVRGVSDPQEWQAALKKKTILTSTARYLLVDHSKFGHRALALFARLDQFDLVITDAGTPTAIQEDLRKRAVKVEVAV